MPTKSRTVKPINAPSSDELWTAAQDYIAAGLHPIALYGVGPDEDGKRPIGHDWQAKPLDPSSLAIAGHNLGLRMGRQPDGTTRVALDIDDWVPAAALEARLGELPDTFTTKSGRGAHLVYEVPPEALPKLSNWTKRDGIDLRAEGGQVVAAPSLHYTGVRYELINDARPAPLPRA